jgi:DNA processing protein
MEEILYYHAIAIAAHGDHHAIKKYRAAVGGDAGSWKATYDALKREGAALPDPERESERLERLGIQLVLSSHHEYPDRLRHIPHPPFGIYVRGEITAVTFANPLTLAIVGTRRASAEGKRTAHDFARELAGAGFTIASGLAFGIDAAAHEGCLDAGGITVAVLAGGLDHVYPYSHESLARKILARGGALISEYPPGEEPYGYRFIERNRIIIGISRGALIVEAPESSGALATARYAVEQNRDLFVVPGSVNAANFKGSHALIRQGAELVTVPDDILKEYDVVKKEHGGTATARGESPEEILVLKAMEEISTAADVDKLVAMTKLEPRIINRTLSFLILRGVVKESEDGYTI